MLHEATCGLGIAEYRRQGLIQFVGQCRGQFAQHVDARQAFHLALGIVGIRLGLDSFRNVFTDTEKSGGGAIGLVDSDR